MVQLRNQNNAVVANYQYDAWDKLLYVYDNSGTEITDANHIAHLNPFRYRGYYYDAETGFYATGTRYYDPFIGRFLNADDTDVMLEHLEESPLSKNLYTYCLNNPVNYADPYGDFALALAGGGSLTAGAALGGVNFWNPVGWVLLGIAAVGTVTLATIEINKYIKNKKEKALVSALSTLRNFSTAASPLPPNDPRSRGTKTSSKSVYNKNGVRIDVENVGNNVGRIHVQTGGSKYYYNIQTMQFYDKNGYLAPRSIQDLLNNKQVVNAIVKACKILGY